MKFRIGRRGGKERSKSILKVLFYRFAICRSLKEVFLWEMMYFWLGREFVDSSIEICVLLKD